MKYMGSKGRIAKDILPIILKDRNPEQWYVEPFVGGGNLIAKVTGNRIGNDFNKYVIALLKEMQNGFDPPYLSREEVAAIRDNVDTYPAHLVAWAAIGCSYSGKWFGGYAGKTVTKEGGLRDYIQEAINSLDKQAEAMKGVLFYSGSYSELVIPPNSIIYCDPPYKNTEGYRVKFNHDTFWDWCRERVTEGHKVFVSEYSAPPDFLCIWQKTLSSSLSANGKIGGNKLSTEKLFVHIDEWVNL
jgi:DNA adenine methylase